MEKMTLNDAHKITQNIEKKLKNEFGKDTHIGIHMEPREDVMTNYSI